MSAAVPTSTPAPTTISRSSCSETGKGDPAEVSQAADDNDNDNDHDEKKTAPEDDDDTGEPVMSNKHKNDVVDDVDLLNVPTEISGCKKEVILDERSPRRGSPPNRRGIGVRVRPPVARLPVCEDAIPGQVLQELPVHPEIDLPPDVTGVIGHGKEKGIS